MAEGKVPIRNVDASQETEALQQIAADVQKVLTPNEEILYVAMQNQTALSLRKDCVVATSNRVILYRPDVLGRVNFDSFLWQDVRNAQIHQGMLSSEFQIETVEGKQDALGNLDKEQAKRLYGVCQQMDQEWREKRRVREMEQDRARSGGVVLSAPSASAEDPVEKLAKAKAMLDQQLISEIEYQALKAKILAAM